MPIKGVALVVVSRSLSSGGYRLLAPAPGCQNVGGRFVAVLVMRSCDLLPSRLWKSDRPDRCLGNGPARPAYGSPLPMWQRVLRATSDVGL